MELRLAENIKRMRKERALTQEALADALGVTVGAVYKWEANLSSPELSMLVRIADLFDTSVDTLLGYEVADNRKQAITDRIYGYIARKDRSGFEDVESALGKYPNDFGVIMAAANLYSAFGTEDRNRDLQKRAIALYNKASRIVPHDIDPQYGKTSIIGNIAFLYFLIDEKDKALSMLKKHNEAGVFNTKIGWLSSMKGDTSTDCLQQLISGFWAINSELINTTFGLIYYYKNVGELNQLKITARWMIEYFDGIRKSKEPCFFDKLSCSCLVSESFAYFKSGDPGKAETLLLDARKLAEKYDSSYHDTMQIKLFEHQGEAGSYSLLGETANETIDSTLNMIGDRKFSALWKNLNK